MMAMAMNHDRMLDVGRKKYDAVSLTLGILRVEGK